jgi:general stress protein 26
MTQNIEAQNIETQNIETRVWDVLAKNSVGMLTTHGAQGLRARPLDARPDRDAGLIRFVTDVRGLKDDEIEADARVGFTVIDPDDNAYLSITGRAAVTRDSITAARIWKTTDDVWWPDGPRDRDVRVLAIEPIKAELWDEPASKLVAVYEFAKARVTGEKPNLGENRKVTLAMGDERQ